MEEPRRTNSNKIFRKEFEKKRAELAVKLIGTKVGSDEYNETKKEIDDINAMLKDSSDPSKEEKKRTKLTALKVIGGLGLGVAGLFLARKNDTGDSIPGKYVNNFVDKIIHWNLK